LLPPREWRLRVEDILEAIAKIEQYVSGLSFEQFQADQKTVDAVVRNQEGLFHAPVAMRSLWPTKSPYEKLSRAMFSPARMRRSSISGDSEAGPIVATILVLWSGSDMGDRRFEISD
jgi:Ribonuclease HepT-like